MKKDVKILVAYHKPSALIESDILIPIHVGRKDAQMRGMSDEEYLWMQSNTIGDDTGDNISSLNPFFCELTGVYWAWKNYCKIQSPDYIGLEHYRRHFIVESSIQDYIQDYDIIAPFEDIGNQTIESQFLSGHTSIDFTQVINLLCDFYPEYSCHAKKYITKSSGYYYNMFIMKKHVFFEYCEWLFNFLFLLHQKIDYSEYNAYDLRMQGFIGERLLGIFIQKKESEGLKIKNAKVIFNYSIALKAKIKPPLEQNTVPIVFCCDDDYAKYLDVAIRSIDSTSSNEHHYWIYICHSRLSNKNRRLILEGHAKNISIKFVDISGYLDSFDKNIFHISDHLSIATYFRFFIPEIFCDFNKIIYLDSDIIVNNDLSKIYNINLFGKSLGAVFDVEALRIINTNIDFKKYVSDVLRLNSFYSYFQAGVLVFDVSKLSKIDFTQKCFSKLQELNNPYFHDQDILNAVLNNDVEYFDISWNVEWHIPLFYPDYERQIPANVYKKYIDARSNPFIIHYSGAKKPWNYPDVELSNYFWRFARSSPFYEEILHCNLTANDFVQPVYVELLKDVFNYRRNLIKYYRYKIFSKLTIGKKRKRYKEKRRKLKARVDFIKGLLL